MSGRRGGERGRDKNVSKTGNKLKVRVKGASHYVVRDKGQLWVLPQEVEKVLNWRRDKRRKKILTRQESQPPDPPGAE